jgi:hypothetical protein
MPRVADLPTHQERSQATLPARREARFRYAQERIRKIVEGAPPLTQEQRDKLAALLRSA